MTLGEGKEKVLKLLDEYSSGGEVTVDEDIAHKMAAFFDTAQKEMAGHSRIIRETKITLDGTAKTHEMPKDFSGVFRIWRNGSLTQRYAFRGKKLVAPAGDTADLVVEYFAVPETINADTRDDYVFEVSEEAANCLPFFVAAQHLLPDLVVDYSVFWDIYISMRAALDVTLPSSGGAAVRQTLFRR